MSINPYHKIIKPLRELSKGKKGIWVNNLTLKKTFEAGDSVRVSYDNKNKIVVVEKSDNPNHTISSRKSDKNNTPILDIKNKALTDIFEDVSKVEISLYEDKLVIEVAKSELKHAKKHNSISNTTFELFCGGGTLTQMFNQNGFTSLGGLEITEKYLKVFESNNSGSKITICSDLLDVQESYYPSGVDTLLAGIPCTKLTPANVQMQSAQMAVNSGTATETQIDLVESKKELDYLTFKVIEAARAMNVRTVVVEEVVAYSKTPACDMLRIILNTCGYHITETISEGSHSKRNRWTLVANANRKINLNTIIEPDSNVIEDYLEIPVSKRDWKPKEDMARILSASKKSTVGVRSHIPSEVKSNTFTTHWTRSTEPVLKHPDLDLYSEFTNQEIANLHGLKDFKMSEQKTTNRQILGQGVTDMFSVIADRIKKDRE